MFRSLTKTLLVLAVILGIALPQVSAALAGLGLTDSRLLVICTGDGLRTIRIDENGEPVEVSHDIEICALVHAADTSKTIAADESERRLLFHSGQVQHVSLVPAEHNISKPLPRGPPTS